MNLISRLDTRTILEGNLESGPAQAEYQERRKEVLMVRTPALALDRSSLQTHEDGSREIPRTLNA